MPIANSRLAPLLCAAFLAATLSACTMSDDKIGTYLVSPDKYTLYNCQQLATETQEKGERERQLEALMAKAGPTADGRLVSSIAYRPEYLQVNAELVELRKAAAAKECASPAAAPAPKPAPKTPR